MAKILSLAECSSTHNCYDCHFPEHPNSCKVSSCLTCPVHCPCCTGRNDGLCNQCPEEDCENRAMPYNPDSVSKKEE